MKKNLKKSLLIISIIYLVTINKSFAKSDGEIPNITGQVLLELKSDRLSGQSKEIKSNNAYINIEPDFSFNFKKNWSIKTGWRLYPTSTVETRNENYPERTRQFFNKNRGFHPGDTTFIVEELKLDFKSDDLEFFLGKFNPSFGKAYNKDKRIGVFSTDITEDYELREKIGFGAFVYLEDSKISLNTFFNDTTGLSGSINGRNVAKRNDGLSANTGSFASYTITIDGNRLLGISNLSYNLGYRNLGVDKNIDEISRETGYVAGSQYVYKIGRLTTINPFAEFVKIKNFMGAEGRDASYSTLALIGKYLSWKISISNIYRKISDYQSYSKINDRQLQYSVGYKLKNGIFLDFSRASVKENPNSGILYGFMASYLYQF